jgi:NTP pyrophosphatase (non-canonical NTP hydrolase)/nucleoside 2-deoxyribosyltransferase
MKTMRRSKTAPASTGQILLFPQLYKGDESASENSDDVPEGSPLAPARGRAVVICGTYRKDPEGLRRTFDKFKDEGFQILSPSNPFIESEQHGFVYMRNESSHSPDQIENRHLDAIQQADFVWFFAPNGYVGPTGALEVGFARANGIPVYSDVELNDVTIKQFVQTVRSPEEVYQQFQARKIAPPIPAVTTFQHYYRKAALERGYTKENAKDCLLLMVEEVGELARALRKRHHLARHGSHITNQEDFELADVFIYVVHMANILKIDLSRIVQQKELININKLTNAK